MGMALLGDLCVFSAFGMGLLHEKQVQRSPIMIHNKYFTILNATEELLLSYREV